MPHTNDNIKLVQRKEVAYDSANRITADENTIRIVYEQILHGSACLSAYSDRKHVMEDEDVHY